MQKVLMDNFPWICGVWDYYFFRGECKILFTWDTIIHDISTEESKTTIHNLIWKSKNKIALLLTKCVVCNFYENTYQVKCVIDVTIWPILMLIN